MSKLSKTILLITFTILFTTPLSAKDSFTASIDKTKVKIGDTITYKLRFEGEIKPATAFHEPKFNGFEIIEEKQSENTTMKINKTITNLLIIYKIMPLKPGTLIIESAYIEDNGKITSKTEGFEVLVTGQPMPEAVPVGQENQIKI